MQDTLEIVVLTPDIEQELKYMGEPTEEQFQKIKEFIPQFFTKADIFIYSVKACSNLLDRDSDIFSTSALKSVSKMLIGVTGIFDHQWSSTNQHSRIFDTILVEDTSKDSPLGEPYRYVVGFAYTLNTPENTNLINNIKSGIFRETSLGFNIETAVPSDIVGVKADIIQSVSDVYEWSFVAIPAQKDAGVIKSFTPIPQEVDNMKVTDAVVKLKSVQSIDTSALSVIETVLKGYDGSNGSFADMQVKLKSLEKDNQDKDVKIKQLEQDLVDTTLNHAISSVLDEFQFVSDVAFGIAQDVAKKGIYLDEEGQVTGIEDVKSAISNDYKFLLGEGVTKELDLETKETDPETKEAEVDEEEEEVEEKEADMDSSVSFKSKQQKKGIEPLGIDFNRSASVKSYVNKNKTTPTPSAGLGLQL